MVVTLVDYGPGVDGAVTWQPVSVLFYIPIVLSLLVLGAHFLRYDNMVGVIAALVVIGLLFIRKPWVARILQAALLLGALEWGHTLYQLVQARAAQGVPATRLVLILATVIAVTAVSALLFESKTLKRIYGR